MQDDDKPARPITVHTARRAVDESELYCEPAFQGMSKRAIAECFHNAETFYNRLTRTGSMPAFWEADGLVRESDLADHTTLVPFLSQVLRSQMTLSDEVTLLAKCLGELEMVEIQFPMLFSDSTAMYPEHYRWNRYCDLVRVRAREPEFQAARRKNHRRAGEQQEAMAKHFDKLLARHNALQVIRIDLKLSGDERFSLPPP